MTSTVALPHAFRGGTNGACAEGDDLSEFEHERAMVETPDAWPQWPILPLKRPNYPFDSDLSTGFLIEQIQYAPVTVYLANIILLQPGRLSDAVKDLNRLEYQNLADFFDAGWRID